jgi:hypothetical protein
MCLPSSRALLQTFTERGLLYCEWWSIRFKLLSGKGECDEWLSYRWLNYEWCLPAAFTTSGKRRRTSHSCRKITSLPTADLCWCNISKGVLKTLSHFIFGNSNVVNVTSLSAPSNMATTKNCCWHTITGLTAFQMSNGIVQATLSSN